jgi:hypothetical protein
MATSHRCTFAISLRLPTGSFWVALYRFLDDSEYSGATKLSDKVTVVARGEGVAHSHIFSDAVWPKDLLEPQSKEVGRSKAKLTYIRKKGDRKVLINIDVWAKRSQTIRLILLEKKAADSDETIEMNGKVSLGEQRNYEPQTLRRTPWGDPDPLDVEFFPMR